MTAERMLDLTVLSHRRSPDHQRRQQRRDQSRDQNPGSVLRAALLFALCAGGTIASGSLHNASRGTIAVQPEGADASTPLAPVRQQRPGAVLDTSSLGLVWIKQLEGITLDIKTARVVPEGTVLVRRPGRLLHAGGQWVFLADRASRAEGEGAMIILPNAVLESIINGIDPYGPIPRVLITGRATLYRGVNGIMLIAAIPEPLAPEPMTDDAAVGATDGTRSVDEPGPTNQSEHADTPEAPEPGDETDPLDADNPDVAQLLAELDNLPSLGGSGELMGSEPANAPNAPANQPLDRAASPSGLSQQASPPSGRQLNSSTENTPIPAGLAAGELMSRRVGRLVRTTSGRWGFAIDRDVNDDPRAPLGRPAPRDGSAVLTIQPCRALERLEAIGLRVGDGARIELSGQVMRFEGRGYILPTVYRVLPVSDLDPMG